MQQMEKQNILDQIVDGNPQIWYAFISLCMLFWFVNTIPQYLTFSHSKWFISHLPLCSELGLQSYMTHKYPLNWTSKKNMYYSFTSP